MMKSTCISATATSGFSSCDRNSSDWTKMLIRLITFISNEPISSSTKAFLLVCHICAITHKQLCVDCKKRPEVDTSIWYLHTLNYFQSSCRTASPSFRTQTAEDHWFMSSQTFDTWPQLVRARDLQWTEFRVCEPSRQQHQLVLFMDDCVLFLSLCLNFGVLVFCFLFFCQWSYLFI